MMWVTVNDMYKCSKDNDFPLLSEFNAPFWNEYLTNHARYDKMFCRMFMSFRYFMQDPLRMNETMTAEHIEDITREFEYDVYTHLMANSKKYAELFRVNVVDDDSYSIVDNYNVTETMERETTKSDSDVYGNRTDTTNDTLGAKSDTTTESIGAKTETVNDTLGAKTDTTTESIGAKSESISNSVGAITETETEQLGQRTDSGTQTIGSRTDTNETVTGEQNNTGTDTIAGFNSSGFENDSRVVDNIGERTDNSETIIGQQSNTNSSTVGAQSNTRSTQHGAHTDSSTTQHGAQSNETETQYGQQSNTRSTQHGAQSNQTQTQYGAQSNSKSFVKGAQTDTHTGSGTEDYTLVRRGNIGVKTATEVMLEHTEFWSTWEFYTFIFKEICAELLLI